MLITLSTVMALSSPYTVVLSVVLALVSNRVL